MSAAKRSDRPAFPIVWPLRDGADTQYVDEGMTLRDYFAAKAMQGMCSGTPWPSSRDYDEIAGRSVALADALLARLSK